MAPSPRTEAATRILELGVPPPSACAVRRRGASRTGRYGTLALSQFTTLTLPVNVKGLLLKPTVIQRPPMKEDDRLLLCLRASEECLLIRFIAA